MLFKLLKLIIWVVGLVGVAYLALRYFGYDINFAYFKDSQAACKAQAQKCREEFMAQGYENPNCQIKDCVINTVDNAQLIIKRQ